MCVMHMRTRCRVLRLYWSRCRKSPAKSKSTAKSVPTIQIGSLKHMVRVFSSRCDNFFSESLKTEISSKINVNRHRRWWRQILRRRPELIGISFVRLCKKYFVDPDHFVIEHYLFIYFDGGESHSSIFVFLWRLVEDKKVKHAFRLLYNAVDIFDFIRNWGAEL